MPSGLLCGLNSTAYRDSLNFLNVIFFLFLVFELLVIILLSSVIFPNHMKEFAETKAVKKTVIVCERNTLSFSLNSDSFIRSNKIVKSFFSVEQTVSLPFAICFFF